jgi:hypothetical protein
VFYRIYANETLLNKDIDTIKTVIKDEADEKVGQNRYNRIVSLGYRELDTDLHENYLTRGSDKIRIRLFDEGFNANTGIWTAGVFVGDDAAEEENPVSVPLRYQVLDNKGFSFFYTDTARKDDNPMPEYGDTDTNHNDYIDDSKWYVNAYAVSVGQDMNFALSYSRIVELGYIVISQF